MRKLHALLRDLGISREDFKRRTGCRSMRQWSERDLCSKIRFALWIGKQSFHIRRAYGASR